MQNGMTAKEARLINSWWGDCFTKRFLMSRHVVMLSEGDYLNRLKICVRVVTLMPFYVVMLGLFLYFHFAIEKQYSGQTTPVLDKLIVDQNVVIDGMIFLMAGQLMLLLYSLIIMLNMSMGRATYFVTMIFNVVYISEALFFWSFIFILDWSGLIKKFTSGQDVLNTFLSQWIYLAIYLLGLICYKTTKRIFIEFNNWNREWIRIDRYRKTEDRENAFIFKTWVTPGEISARKHMIAVAILFILAANVMDLVDVLNFSDFDVATYLLLGVGYFIFIASFVMPYSKWSLFYYWSCFAFAFGVLLFGLYHIQATAWDHGNWFEYAYVLTVIPFLVAMVGAIRYTWTIRNKEEIQAIVISEFESAEDFAKFIDQNKDEKAQPVPVDALNV
jgi:hypothetical protein